MNKEGVKLILLDADDAEYAEGRRFILLIINNICALLRYLRPMNTDIDTLSSLFNGYYFLCSFPNCPLSILKIVIEIARYLLIQMRTVFADHIMQMAGINEIVRICIRIHTSFQES